MNIKQATLLPALTLLCATAFAGSGTMEPRTPEGCMVEAAQRPQSPSAKGKVLATGKVVDKVGEPVIGATVMEKGTHNGVITDANGNYSIYVSPGNSLIISYIGFADREQEGGKDRTVTLDDNTEDLNEVVVIGYGSVEKADLAGSISVMNSKKFQDQPITQLTDALQGRVSGVTINTTGQPGEVPSILIRGTNSINLSNQPLWVVDGVIRSDGAYGLNPSDIQSIQILKDASSTAIYGSRGANGVILVTTKKGHYGQKHITFEANAGMSHIYDYYDIVSPYEFATEFNKYQPNTFDQQQLSDFQSGRKGCDWQKAITQTGWTQDYKFAFTNGSEKSNYYFSGNYMDQTGIILGTRANRLNFRGNFSSVITDWFSFTADFNISHNKQYKTTGWNYLNSLNFAPVISLRNDDGTYDLTRDSYSLIDQSNPVARQKWNDHRQINDILNGRLELNFIIQPGLTFNSTNSVDYDASQNMNFSTGKLGGTNGMSNNGGNSLTWQTTNNLTYAHKWGGHSLTATGVFEAQKNKYTARNISGSNLSPEDVGWWNIAVAGTKNPGLGYSEWSMASFLGRVLYNYRDRYLATVSFRADGSSHFINKKWGYFPSVGLAWNLGNEKFMQDQNVFQNVKIRASYGTIGNQGISSYTTLGLLQGATTYYGTSTPYSGYWIGSAMPTPDLSWEKTRQLDLGLEFGILDNRIRFTFDYYNKETHDALLMRTIPSYDGGGSYWTNVGKVRNCGLDVTIDANVFNNKDFSWSTTFNLSYSTNKVKSLAGLPFLDGTTPLGGTLQESINRIVVGKPIGSFYLYKWTGLDDKGCDSYADLDGDGEHSVGDKEILGDPNPDVVLGWNNTFTYKNWSLNIFMTSALGMQRFNMLDFTTCSQTGAYNFYTAKKAISNMDGNCDHPTYPNFVNTRNGTELASSRWLQDADYLRLDNIALSYNLKKSVTKFADITLSLSAQNLFVITGYDGSSPVCYNSNSSLNSGYDFGLYPLTRTFSFGAKFTF